MEWWRHEHRLRERWRGQLRLFRLR
nr:hypothetical protein [Mycobacterium spongiae]